MVFGDNVRARRAARALPRTPTRQKEEEEENRENKQRKLHTHHTTAIPQLATQYDKIRQDTYCHHNMSGVQTVDTVTIPQTITAIPQ